MQPVLSVDQSGRPHSGSRPVRLGLDLSLFFDGSDFPDHNGDQDVEPFLLAAVSFARAYGFSAVWPPSHATESNACLAAIAHDVELRGITSVPPGATQVNLVGHLWIAAEDQPELFKTAAQIGARVLTRLLGRSIESVEKDIALYRRTWTESGHSGQGYVTVAVPTLVAADEEFVNRTAVTAMKEQLRRKPSLMREALWDYPQFVTASDELGSTLDEFVATRNAEQLDALLTFAARHYVATSGLFGGQSGCLAFVERLKRIGVDEIACLIDFGWPTAVAIESLPALDELRCALSSSNFIGSEISDDRTAKTNGSPMGHLLPIQSPISGQQPDTHPRTQTQQKIAELWCTLLDVPDVGPGDNFFDLGGHSLLAAHAVSQIERAFGVRVPIKTLLISSLNQVAAEIDREVAESIIVDRCEETPRDITPKSESSNVGRLASWFKNARNGDRFQDGSQPC